MSFDEFWYACCVDSYNDEFTVDREVREGNLIEFNAWKYSIDDMI